MIPHAAEDVVLSFIAGQNAKWYSHWGRQSGGVLQNKTHAYTGCSNLAPWYLLQGVENLCFAHGYL